MFVALANKDEHLEMVTHGAEKIINASEEDVAFFLMLELLLIPPSGSQSTKTSTPSSNGVRRGLSSSIEP